MEGEMKKGCFKLMLAAILCLAIAGTTYAFSFDFHGKMWQTVGVTDNYSAMAVPKKVAQRIISVTTAALIVRA